MPCFPGCGLRFTDGHHIVHWADGGPTTLQNLALLCERHHRRVHEGGYRICSGADGEIVFFTPEGRALHEAAPTPGLSPDPVRDLVRGNRDRGVFLDGWAAAPRWHRDRDIPWEIEAAAREALDPWDDESAPARRGVQGVAETRTGSHVPLVPALTLAAPLDRLGGPPMDRGLSRQRTGRGGDCGRGRDPPERPRSPSPPSGGKKHLELVDTPSLAPALLLTLKRVRPNTVSWIDGLRHRLHVLLRVRSRVRLSHGTGEA